MPTNKEKHVILSLVTPPSSHAADSAPLVSAVFGLIDALEKVNLRLETKSKLKRTREDFAKSLRDEAEREAREEAADAKLAAKRRAEEERIAGLSAAEQQKVHTILILALLSLCSHAIQPSTSSWSAIASAICARHRESWSKNELIWVRANCAMCLLQYYQSKIIYFLSADSKTDKRDRPLWVVCEPIRSIRVRGRGCWHGHRRCRAALR
jgi:hypothetical protein